MARIKMRRLVWDEINTEHIKKHRVSVSEVEEVGENLLVHQKAKKDRYLIIGRTAGRILTVILNRKGIGIYYPVTARDAAKKERKKIYDKESKKTT